MAEDKRFVTINNCKHYFLNEKGTMDIYFIHSSFFVEKDFMLNHPLGRVFKPKGCIDTIIRFVRQPDNSTFMFKLNEWNVPSNPYYQSKPKFSFKDIINGKNKSWK